MADTTAAPIADHRIKADTIKILALETTTAGTSARPVTPSPADQAFRLRFRAEAMEAAASQAAPDRAAELRRKADDLRRQAFMIEETGR